VTSSLASSRKTGQRPVEKPTEILKEQVKKSWFNCSMRIWLIGDEVTFVEAPFVRGVSPGADLPLPMVGGSPHQVIHVKQTSKRSFPNPASYRARCTVIGVSDAQQRHLPIVRPPSGLSCCPGHGCSCRRQVVIVTDSSYPCLQLCGVLYLYGINSTCLSQFNSHQSLRFRPVFPLLLDVDIINVDLTFFTLFIEQGLLGCCYSQIE
jgi:hypothetical protein